MVLILSAINPRINNQIFNVTYGKAQSLLKFAQTLRKFIPGLKFKISPRDKFRPKRGTLSISKAKKLLKYRPKYNLETGIKEYLSFYKKNKI